MTSSALNGPGVIRAVDSALSGGSVKPSAADVIRMQLSTQGDAPDGTNGMTKSRAVDPSQGYGGRRNSTNPDPLLTALQRVVGI